MKRTVFVTSKDAQTFNTLMNEAIVDTYDKGHSVDSIEFNSTCEQGQTEYSALLVIGITYYPGGRE